MCVCVLQDLSGAVSPPPTICPAVSFHLCIALWENSVHQHTVWFENTSFCLLSSVNILKTCSEAVWIWDTATDWLSYLTQNRGSEASEILHESHPGPHAPDSACLSPFHVFHKLSLSERSQYANHAKSNNCCFPGWLQNVLRKRDQSQAEYEGRLEAAILRKQEDRTPVSLLLLLVWIGSSSRT